jgi:hypothetical protein
MKLTTTTLALLAAIILVPVAARASISTVPAGLNPGDEYRLVFVTSWNYGFPSSTDIGTYNTIVNDLAQSVPELAELNVQWNVLGSTQSVNARQNTGTDPSLGGVPIFLLNGDRIATDYADLWDGTLENALNITETGVAYTPNMHPGNGAYYIWAGQVWTGSSNSGLAQFSSLGGPNGHVVIGNPNTNNWMSNTDANYLGRLPFYAMSDVLKVPDSTDPGNPGVVPEAASMLTWCGLALTAYWGKTARRRRA